MAKRTFSSGSASQTVDLFIQDSSSTTGLGLAGLAFGSSGLKAYYRRGPIGTAIAITLVTQTVTGNYTTGGFVEIDATNMKGQYRLDLPDAVLASTGSPPYATLFLYGATNMAPNVAELEIVAYNPQDSIRLGLAALPNTAAQSPGGLYTRGAGAGQINQAANGQIDVNAVGWAGAATATNDVALVTAPTNFPALNISAGGSVAIDWGAIENAGATVNLSATIVNTVAILGESSIGGDAVTGGAAIAIADGLLDRSDAIEIGLTPRKALRLTAAMLGGKVSGGGTGTETFRNAVVDSKNRLVITDDASGNRTAITYDLT